MMTIDTAHSSNPVDLAISARADLVGGAMNWRLWGRLGWLDIKRRYKRTVLGPFWSTLSFAIFVTAIGTMGVGLFSVNAGEYMTFLSSGMVVWIMLQTIMTEGSGLFINESVNISQLRFHYSILAFSCVWRNLIAFFHNVLIYIFIALLFGRLPLTPEVFLVIPGAFLLLLNGLWLALCFGLFCVRYRDIQQVVMSIVQIAMFITPILWPPDNLEGLRRLFFVTLHPLYHLIQMMRAPLLGNVPSLQSYLTVLMITVVGWTFTYFMYKRFRKRIAYWL